MKAKVYLNGKFIGFHDDLSKFVSKFKDFKKKSGLHEATIKYDEEDGTVFINTDRGRVIRPYIVVKNGKPLLTKQHIEKIEKGELKWMDLLNEGVVEFLDADEESNAYIAVSPDELTPEHTHLEMDPFTLLGVVASTIPFVNHNMSTRNIMTASMTKQALSLYSSNYNLRMDSRAHLLHYPHVPLVRTRSWDYLNLSRRPFAMNLVVAVMSYDGFNMEDAVILNKSAVDRALGRISFFRTYTTEELRYPGGQKDKFEIPGAHVSGYLGEKAYKYLGEDGIISPETFVGPGTVLVGKTSPPRFLGEMSVFGVMEEKRRENSLTVRHGEGGVVDSVMVTMSSGGNKMVSVKVRDDMAPEIGDKFSSRHAQKGVVGMVYRQADLPFNFQGVSPDLIMNPHSIPSRMTVGHVLDLISGKVASLKPQTVDASAFEEPLSEEELANTLKSYGFREDGKEVMYDGRTGEMFEMKIFTGVITYYRLKHLVSLKVHARARGPTQILTRQPTEGRAREGGLRFGEMERDALIGHGASATLVERMLKESDETEIYVCDKCGVFAVVDHVKHKAYCPLCGGTKVSKIKVAYAFKLLVDELVSLGLYPKLITSERV